MGFGVVTCSLAYQWDTVRVLEYRVPTRVCRVLVARRSPPCAGNRNSCPRLSFLSLSRARGQVRFAFELLCALQPGMPVMALHGKCKHARRTQIYLDFVRRPGAVLLATDIAARGLDFPSVDWVIQVNGVAS